MADNYSYNSIACQELFDQAARGGRKEILFGDSWKRALDTTMPLVEGVPFPTIYMEMPLKGDPFLDMTIGYKELAPGTRFNTEAIKGTEGMLDWLAEVTKENEGLYGGYEIDTSSDPIPPAAVHFQPRTRKELVQPFCDALGEPDRGKLYLSATQIMPKRWPLSFFGMFRGRPNYPLRICGYLHQEEINLCAASSDQIKKTFESVGFKAYNEDMIAQIALLLVEAREGADFQFDIFPDKSFSKTFAIDVNLNLRKKEKLSKALGEGELQGLRKLFDDWNIVDDRFDTAFGIATAKAVPYLTPEEKISFYKLIIIPQWIKFRWTDGVIQPAKLYCLAMAEF